MTTIDEFRTRVRKGITLIEEYEAGATDRIDLSTLDLYSLTHCASAQSVGDGDFGRAQRRLGVARSDDAAAVYGFAITYAEEDTDHDGFYAALRQAWVIELTEHRAAREMGAHLIRLHEGN